MDLGLLDNEPARPLHEIRLERSQAYRSSLPYYDNTEAKQQELRQTLLVEEDIIWEVHLAREDFPDIKCDVTLTFKMSSAQTAWLPLMSEVRKKLGLEFIYVIVEREDLTPVYNILSMQHDGEYLVRQRESSAVLETIISRKVPQSISWPITQFVNSAQAELDFVETTKPKLDSRVKSIVSRPWIRKQERQALQNMLEATEPQQIMDNIMWVMNIKEEGEDFPKDEYGDPIYPKDENGKDIKHDTEIDLINVHRCALECLIRLANRGKGKEMADCAARFVVETVYKYQDQTDIIVVGLALMGQYGHLFYKKKAQVLHCIMDCIQAFTPPPPIQRPRRPKRLIPSSYDLLAAELEAQKAEEERLQKEKELKERLEREERERLAEEERLRKEEEARIEREKLEAKMARRAARKAKKANSKAGRAAAAKMAAAAAAKAAHQASKPPPIKKAPPIFGKKKEKPKEIEVKLPTLEDLNIPDPETMPIIPLDSVPGVTFRGISATINFKTCLLHSVAAIHAFVDKGPFLYRELCYSMYVHEELADVALVLQAYPDILSYIVWTIDRIYTDGYLVDGRFDDLIENVDEVCDDAASRGSEAVMNYSFIDPDSDLDSDLDFDDDNSDHNNNSNSNSKNNNNTKDKSKKENEINVTVDAKADPKQKMEVNDQYNPNPNGIDNATKEMKNLDINNSSSSDSNGKGGQKETVSDDVGTKYAEDKAEEKKDSKDNKGNKEGNDQDDDEESVYSCTGAFLDAVSDVTSNPYELDDFFEDCPIPDEIHIHLLAAVMESEEDDGSQTGSKTGNKNNTNNKGSSDNAKNDNKNDNTTGKSTTTTPATTTTTNNNNKNNNNNNNATIKGNPAATTIDDDDDEDVKPPPEPVAEGWLALTETNLKERIFGEYHPDNRRVTLKGPAGEEVEVLGPYGPWDNPPTPRSGDSNITNCGLDLQAEREYEARMEEEKREKERLKKQEKADKREKKRREAMTDEERTALEEAEAKVIEDSRIEAEEKEKNRVKSEAELLGVNVHRELENDYAKRYFNRPDEDVMLMCFGMVKAHPDVHDREKRLANKWLYRWDDNTPSYMDAVALGVNIAAR